MADKKISALTASSTPLAGTEVLPIVQSGVTVKVSVANLTAGRPVSASSLSASTLFTTAQAASPATYGGNVYVYSGAGLNAAVGGVEWQYATAGSGYGFKVNANGGTDALEFGYRANSASWTRALAIGNTGNIAVDVGNLVVGTAGKGIDFSANGGDVLSQYDEGTWTPNQGAGLTVIGSFSSSGKYTRIGRQVTVTGFVKGSTSIAVGAASNICTNLPFTVASGGDTGGQGVCVNDGVNGSSNITAYSTIITSVSAIGATPGLYFTVTYFV